MDCCSVGMLKPVKRGERDFAQRDQANQGAQHQCRCQRQCSQSFVLELAMMESKNTCCHDATQPRQRVRM